MRSSGWNFADMWEHVVDRFPNEAAVLSGANATTWGDLDRRADGIATTLLAAGVQQQDKVAHYLYNCAEYLESMYGLFKAALVPVNTNYRYHDDELVYLWDNSDSVAVIFHGAFAERCDRIRPRVPRVRTWIWVDDGTGPRPEWATPYETAAAAGNGRTMAPWGRSPDDLILLYTGGTTGLPKGVMWRQDDFIGALDSASSRPLPVTPGWSEYDERIATPGPRMAVAAPLMHGTGAGNAMWNLTRAGSVVTLKGRRFDPIELLDTVEQHHVQSLSIVGDAFARPILEALDATPRRWDLSSLRVIMSSGVMWAAETKQGLLRHHDRLIMIDSLGASETVAAAGSVTRAGTVDAPARTATFTLGNRATVLTDDGREVEPGSGERGRVAVRGPTPIGYYKDEAKTAATFVKIDGMRWSIPGDWAEVAADGTLILYGRGSQCINTGGEKVFPEEVEEVLKRHPTVVDAAVVGVPHHRFGQAITALVETRGRELDGAALIAHVREHLAHYKAPRHVLGVATLGRSASGKLDYSGLRDTALARLGELRSPSRPEPPDAMPGV